MNMKLMIIALVFGLGFIFLCTGCATATRGTTQSLYVNSAPTGATVEIDGGYHGITPFSAVLKRGQNHSLRFTKNGYRDATFTVERKFVGSSLVGNILLGGLIGIGVDLCTGAAYDLEPQTVLVTMEPKGELSIRPPERRDDLDQ